MEPLRRTQDATNFKRVIVGGEEKYVPCSPSEKGAFEITLYELAEQGKKTYKMTSDVD